MLKKDITYKTFFSDEEVTETLYFNFTKTELTEIFMTEPQFLENLQEVYRRAEAGDVDGRALISAIKDVIRRSYGERDGETFAKSPEISDHFLKSAAFDAFFFDLMSNPEDTAAFIENVMPADLIAEAKKDGTFPKLQDHLPKQASPKNVFEQADLGKYQEPVAPHEDEYLTPDEIASDDFEGNDRRQVPPAEGLSIEQLRAELAKRTGE